MADNPNPELDVPETKGPETAAPADKPKKKGVKRRIFLIGSALVVGGGIFGVWWADSSGKALTEALRRHGAPPQPLREQPIRWVRKPKAQDVRI